MDTAFHVEIQKEMARVENLGMTVELNIPLNLTCREEFIVSDEFVTKHIEGLEILSTPSLVLLIEKTAKDCIQPHLPTGYTSVGTQINVKHMNPVPRGEKVLIEASVTEVAGRKIVFVAKSFWNKIVVGEAVHERYVVNIDKFKEKIMKLSSESS